MSGNPNIWLHPVTLVGTRVRLEPLDYKHALDLLKVAGHDQVWAYLDEPTPRSLNDIEALIQQARTEFDNGQRLPFAIIETASNRAVGSTSYIDIRPRGLGVEIGWTWLGPSAWGRKINTEAKYLLLRHAFECLSAIRVAIKTDDRNIRSEGAIRALGAVQEGLGRNYWVLRDGYKRNTIYFSIIDDDWPRVKSHLEERLICVGN